jgi:methylated-DNA-[protein]-cysteine S-methyltransferase
MRRAVLETPIGGIGVSVVDTALVGVSFGAGELATTGEPAGKGALAVKGAPATGEGAGLAGAGRARTADGGEDAALADTLRQLREYFAGERTEFGLPLVVQRGSEFERAVWAEIAAIPYGETLSYGAIARAVGEPGGAQAVGLACNRNPLPVVVPCHRVIGSDGKLVGFGGGVGRKRWLLSLEARVHIERTFAAGW